MQATLTAPKTRTRRAAKTNSHDIKLGEKLAPRMALYSLLSPQNAPIAFATCRFRICGWQVGTHNGAPRNSTEDPFKGQGRWFRTDLTTFNQLPSENFKRHKNGRVSWCDNVHGMNDILNIFNLSVNDVINHYGNVDGLHRLELTLPQIVRDMTNFAKQCCTRV